MLRINDNPKRPKEDRQNVDIIFFATAVKQIKTSDEEVTKLQWFDMDKLPQKELIAFDHGEDIDIYFKYLKQKITIPVIG